jgi:hypothetical protein
MSTEPATQLPASPPLSSSDLFCFRWWYKGRTAEGSILKLEGYVTAADARAACDIVEREMRAKHPTVRWMQGREIEGDGFTFGPTVQKLKRKQNEQGQARRENL